MRIEIPDFPDPPPWHLIVVDAGNEIIAVYKYDPTLTAIKQEDDQIEEDLAREPSKVPS